jgi:hypothetical protein
MRLLEKDALVADAKYKFIVSVRLDLTQMFDQLDGFAPTQIVGKVAAEKILVQRVEMLAHLTSIVLCGYKANTRLRERWETVK